MRCEVISHQSPWPHPQCDKIFYKNLVTGFSWSPLVTWCSTSRRRKRTRRSREAISLLNVPISPHVQSVVLTLCNVWKEWNQWYFMRMKELVTSDILMGGGEKCSGEGLGPHFQLSTFLAAVNSRKIIFQFDHPSTETWKGDYLFHSNHL